MTTFETRSALSQPGKCSTSLDVPMPEDLMDAVTVESTLKRIPRAELARQILTRHFWGEVGRIQRSMNDGTATVHPINVGGR